MAGRRKPGGPPRDSTPRLPAANETSLLRAAYSLPALPPTFIAQGLGGAESASWRRTQQSSAGGWDQFAVNEQLTGQRSTYREELYTTKLSSNISREQQAEAARLAKEIEGKVSTNMHIAEERNQRRADATRPRARTLRHSASHL